VREWIDSRIRSPPAMTVLCVLPARLGSRRIPRKPLQPIAGRPLVEWSWRAACRVQAFDAVWVATDSEEIAMRVRSFGGTALLTRPDHPSGTDRVAEVAARPEARRFDVLVNYQADEPFLDPEGVSAAVEVVASGGAEVATVAVPIRDAAEWRSPSVVKVVRAADGTALYFSRAPVPHPRDGEPEFESRGAGPYLRHVGVYVATRDALERWTGSPPSPLEGIEKLEQLRALEAGLRIAVVVSAAAGPGVDVPADLERAERRLAETVPIERVEADD
jgi:3-deoxy-manno-octulosonate cytidylyltransferase (CMP-KDO synthetase)